MSKLLEEFKSEQETITNLLNKIKRLGVHTMEGRNELLEAKEQLCRHMNRQIKELYPELKRQAEQDPELKNYVENFENEMKGISTFCGDFFEKYSLGGGGIEFFRDFEKFKSKLENSLQEEKDLLNRKET
jgi:hypothetical protein